VREVRVVAGQPRPADHDLATARRAQRGGGEAIGVDGRRDDHRLVRRRCRGRQVPVARHHAVGQRDEPPELRGRAPLPLEDGVVEVEDRPTTARRPALEGDGGKLGHRSLEDDDVVLAKIAELPEPRQRRERHVEPARLIERPGEPRVAVDAGARDPQLARHAPGRERPRQGEPPGA
jgi:hypothetical protein